MMRAVLLFCVLGHTAFGGLEQFRELVVADPPGTFNRAGIRVTYLGTNGYQLESQGHALFIDPYFSRLPVSSVVFDRPLVPDKARINQALRRLVQKRTDAILITHGHVDHLFDTPALMQRNDAQLFASSTAISLAESAGTPTNRCHTVAPGDVRRIGPWKIRILSATHDRIFPIGVPFSRARNTKAPPRYASDWVCGQPLAFLIETNGRRIYIDSGGRRDALPPPNMAPVDLAILGVALPDSRARFIDAIRRLRPRYILPSHQDNFFRPLAQGFQFGPLTNFPGVLRDYRRQESPGRLILLDYFRGWTLP